MQRIDLQNDLDARRALLEAREVFVRLKKSTPPLLPDLSDIRNASNNVIVNLDHLLKSTTPVSYMEIVAGMMCGAGLLGAAQAELQSSPQNTRNPRQKILREFCVDFDKSGYTTTIAQQLENAKDPIPKQRSF